MSNILDVNFDRSEMIVQVANGKHVSNQHIPSDQINRIQFGEGVVKSWFSKKTLPKIEIYVRGREEPLVLQSGKSNQKFEEAEFVIRQFAEKNEVPVEG